LLNLLDGPLRAAVEVLPDKYLMMTEKELKRHVDPDEVTCRLRIQFWDEYNQACDDGRPMQICNIMRGLVYTEYFYSAILPDEKKLAWIIKPPADFLLAMRDLLYMGMERLREVLELPFVERVPLFDKDGKQRVDAQGRPVFRESVNVRLVAEVRAITTEMQNRVHGAVIQRMAVQTQNQSLHVLASADPLGDVPLPTDALAALDAQLSKVSKRLEAAEALANPPVPAEPEFIDTLGATVPRPAVHPADDLDLP
jgi:hypothetical protein